MNTNETIYKVSLEFETTGMNLISLTFKLDDTSLSDSEARSLTLSALIDVMNALKNDPFNTYVE